MDCLITDLLAYARAGNVVDEVELVFLDEIVEDVKVVHQHAIREKEAEIVCEELPTLYSSRTGIRQILYNLVGNAIHYVPSGTKPRVTITATDLESHWHISASDNGIGIPEEFRSTTFNIFERLHSKEEYGGTGLGLAICRKYVHRHGGRIWVDSEPGVGSTFHFTLAKTGDIKA